MKKKSITILFFCILFATCSFAAKSALSIPIRNLSTIRKPMSGCQTFSFTPSCRTTPGSITVCGASGFFQTLLAYVSAAVVNEEAACPTGSDGSGSSVFMEW
jgi:hypothetical protein